MSGTYSFNDVVATLVGPTGSANLGYGASVAEEGIKIAPGGDKNTMRIGADGNGMHSLHADNSGSVVVRLLKVSPINAILMAMYDAQKASTNLWGQNVIVVRQVASGDIHTATRCAFKKKPDMDYAKDSVLGQY
jgi:hypothetical protein